MKSIVKIVLIVFWIIISIFIIQYGRQQRSKLLSHNTCDMTMTSRDKHRVGTNSSTIGPKLYKYITPINERGGKGDKQTNNPQPVLFVPGHRGSVDQVRSFAAYDHNADSFFQYFSIDFGNYSDSGLHAIDIVNQAVYVNDAILAIKRLYGDKWADTKLMITGHSIGGMVARTALLLSNYPNDCPVSDILMLSTPNTRHPFGIDVSMSKLYTAVNDGWKSSLNRNERCHEQNVHVTPSKSLHLKKCVPCLGQTKLISLSGGTMDLMVKADLTTLYHLSPILRNMTIEREKEDNDLSVGKAFAPIAVIFHLLTLPIRWFYSPGTSTPMQAKPLNESSSNNFSLEAVETLSNAAGSTDSVDASALNPADSADNNVPRDDSEESKDKPASIISQDNAVANPETSHSNRIYEPYLLSLRSSMLRDVDASIDHTAILWCHQLLQALTKGLRKLSNQARIENNAKECTNPMTCDDNRIIWENIFDFKSNNDLAMGNMNSSHGSTSSEDILRDIYERRKGNHATWKYYENYEKQSILVKFSQDLGYSFVNQILALVGFNIYSDMWRIIPCYLMISIFTILAPITLRLTGHKDEVIRMQNAYQGTISSVELLAALFTQSSPFYHWNYDMMLSSLSSLISRQTLISSPYVIAIVLVAITTVEGYWLSKTEFGLITLISLIGRIMSWFVSYGLALALRYALCVAVVVIRILISWTRYLPIFSHMTNKFISSKPTAYDIITLEDPRTVMWYTIILFIAFVSLNAQRASFDTPGYLPLFVFITNLIGISTFLAIAINIFMMIVKSYVVGLNPLASVYQAIELVNFSMLYITMLLFSYPMTVTAWKVLVLRNDSLTSSAIPLVGTIYTNLLTYSLFTQIASLSVVWIHTSMLLNDKCFFDDSVKANGYLRDLFGPLEQDADKLRKTNTSSRNISSDAICLHEDGGKNAILERCDDDFECVEISRGVIIGPTYRVVFCDCSVNRLLKDQREWCEYCRCKRCGPLKGNNELYSRDNRTFAFEVFRYLGISLPILTYGFVIGMDSVYAYMYLLGLVGVVCVARHALNPLVLQSNY